MRLLAFLLCSPAFAVTLLKVAAGPGGAGWVPDAPYVSGGLTQAVVGGNAIPYNFLRYSPPTSSIQYSFQISGVTSVTLFFIEPRAAQTVGQRLFSVTLNGVPILTNFDLFVSAGILTPKSVTFPVQAQAGPLLIEIRSTVGNAVISGIQVDGNLPPPPPPPPAAITCKMGTVPFSAITTQTMTQEVVIMAAVPDTYRILHIMINEAKRFTGSAASLTVSMEPTLTPPVKLMNPNANPWIDRSVWPTGIGPYDIKVRFSGESALAGSLTAGSLAWEVCGFDVSSLVP